MTNNTIFRWMINAAAVVVLLFIVNSCSDPDDCFTSTGKIVKQERVLEPFRSVFTADNIHVIFTNTSSYSITVEAGENLLPEIKSEVKEGQLLLTNENSCNWVRSYKKLIKVYIGIGYVKDIFHYSYGDIESETLTKDTLFVHHYSSGDINLNIHSNQLWIDADKLGTFRLNGTTNRLLAYQYNLGQIRAENLTAQTVYITNFGNGDMHVKSTNTIGARIKGEGNIYYYGNPSSVGVEKSGEGNLIKGD